MSLGADGVILIFEQVVADFYRPIEAVATRAGCKTFALDPVTRILYTMAPAGSRNLRGNEISFAPDSEPFYPNAWQAGSQTVFAFVPTH